MVFDYSIIHLVRADLLTFIVYGVLMLAMTAEYQRTGIYQQTGIKEKSDKRWHADKTEICVAISSVEFLVASHFLGGPYATFALMMAIVDLAALQNKAENTARSKKQSNPSRQLPM